MSFDQDWTNDEFTTYLTNVARDHRESGNDATAEDYVRAAARIESLMATLRTVKRQQDAASRHLRDALVALPIIT